VFVNYGFVSSAVEAQMHPRGLASRWPPGRRQRAHLLLEFVRERGSVHPREVDRHFSHGRVTNYWGGSSSATTHLMDLMHYGGLLRVVRREAGVRIYALHERGDSLDAPKLDGRHKRHAEPAAPTCPADASRQDLSRRRKLDAIPSSEGERIDALVDVAVGIYAPLPAATLSYLVRRLRYAAPQWHGELGKALQRARHRLAHAQVDGMDWYWPAGERPIRRLRLDEHEEAVRLLAPFDPIVWDRLRFERLWGWQYRFEAYTPAAKRKLGYYALPLLWRDHVIGWANLSMKNGELQADIGYVAARPPRDRKFGLALEAELDRMRFFLGADLNAGVRAVVKDAVSTGRRRR
jgi:uncharacterized protein YcaQ